MRAAASNADFFNRGATNWTFLPCSVEDLGKFIEIIATGAVGFNVIFHSGATGSNGLFHDVFHGGEQIFGLGFREGVRFGFWVDFSREQRFVSVDVAKPADDSLV